MTSNKFVILFFDYYSEATKGSLDECDVEDVRQECVEYNEKLEELQRLLEDQKPAMAALQTMANEVKQVKLANPSSSKVSSTDSPQLQEAMAEAKSITEEKGIQSAEARIAWETVEEIAASGNDNAMGARLTDECLVDAAIEACTALEELNRVLDEQQKSD